jgi:multidrug efflux pump subunit AcrB
VRDVAAVAEGSMPGEYDRYNMRRVVSPLCEHRGEDLGRVSARVEKAIKAAGMPPRGVTVQLRGRCPPMQEMFRAWRSAWSWPWWSSSSS